jgi:hypothetical protein
MIAELTPHVLAFDHCEVYNPSATNGGPIA